MVDMNLYKAENIVRSLGYRADVIHVPVVEKRVFAVGKQGDDYGIIIDVDTLLTLSKEEIVYWIEDSYAKNMLVKLNAEKIAHEFIQATRINAMLKENTLFNINESLA